MKTNWQYKHIVDLEYFCHQDAESDDKTLHQRDRDIFLHNRELTKNDNEPTNRDLIKLWLADRVKTSFPGPDKKSPGTILSDTYLLARKLAVIIGIFIGATAGISFFTYTGTTPVNVFHFLFFFVISQLTLVGFLLMTFLLRPFLPGLKIPSFYSLLFQGMFSRSLSFFHKHRLRTMATEKRASVNHAFGIFKARGSLYGSLFYWPLFVLAQLVAIGFNVGLLATTLVKILTSDLAFGWQSTMQFSAEAIHRTVMFAALPWSWLVPEAGSYPSLTEIEGSRIILKDGIYHLTTGNLIAWWPFLVFCLLFYGLVLRLALFFMGKLMERRSLHNVKLDTPACLAIVRRMQTPLVSTQAKPEPKKTPQEKYRHQSTETTHLPLPDFSAQIVLIPDDIYPNCPTEQLAPLLQQRGLTIKEGEIHRFMVSYDHDQHLRQLLADKEWAPGEGIFILMEGWMVPLVDFLSYLKDLRAILPKNGIIYLGLVGRPAESVLTPVTPADFTIWRQKIEAIGDPYLTIFSLISSQEKL